MIKFNRTAVSSDWSTAPKIIIIIQKLNVLYVSMNTRKYFIFCCTIKDNLAFTVKRLLLWSDSRWEHWQTAQHMVLGESIINSLYRCDTSCNLFWVVYADKKWRPWIPFLIKLATTQISGKGRNLLDFIVSWLSPLVLL